MVERLKSIQNKKFILLQKKLDKTAAIKYKHGERKEN